MYFWLQEHEPLSRVKLPYGDEGWLLTRYDDVRAALGDPRFSLAEAAVRDVPRLTPQRYGAILTDLDPPDHQLHLRPADPPRPARPAAFASRADAGRGGGADALGAVAGDGRHAAALRARRRPAQQRHCSRWRSDPAAKHAANRDPRTYENPNRLDLTRNAQGQLGFGHGAHHGLGAPLARMDLQVALTALLARFPDLHLAVAEDELQWKTGMAVRGPVALPIGW